MNHQTNICFVANYTFTFLFHELAEKLKSENLQSYWIVNNQKLYDYLKERYDDDRILYISRAHFDMPSEPVSDFKLNELVYGDRVLRY